MPRHAAGRENGIAGPSLPAYLIHHRDLRNEDHFLAALAAIETCAHAFR